MAYVYTVEFRQGPSAIDGPCSERASENTSSPTTATRPSQLARQLMRVQDPCIDAERIDLFKVVRRPS